MNKYRVDDSTIRSRLWSTTEPGTIYFWLPALVLAAATIALAILDIRTVYEPKWLFPALNWTLLVGASVLGMMVAAQGFMRDGSPTLLFMSLGVFAFGIGAALGPLFLAAGDPGTAVASHNSIALFSAAIHAASALHVWSTPAAINRRRALLTAGHGLVALTAVAISVAAVRGIIPDFIGSTGTTSPRVAVLTGAVILFLLAGSEFGVRAHKAHAEFLHWYSMGLVLIGIGLAAVALGPVGSPIGWVGRVAQVAGHLYILMCLAVTLRSAQNPSTADAVGSSFHRMEQRLQEAHRRYDVLFESVTDAIVLWRLQDDALEMVQCNRAFVELAGRRREQMRPLRIDRVLAIADGPESIPQRLTRDGKALDRAELVRRDGGRVPVEIHTSLVDGENGELAISVIRDMSMRLELETRRETEASRLKQVFAESPLCMELLDRNGAVVLTNGGVARLWGREDLPPVQGIDDFERYPARHHGTDISVRAHEWPAARVIAGEPQADLVVDITRPDGDIVTARFSARPLESPTEHTQVLVTGQDITAELSQQRLLSSLDTIRTVVTSTFDASEIERRIAYMGAEALRADGAILLEQHDDRWRLLDSFGTLAGLTQVDFAMSQDDPLTTAVKQRRSVGCPGTECPIASIPTGLRRTGVKALLAVPLLRAGDTVATCAFAWTSERRPTLAQLDFANRLLGVSALALHNSEAYQRERTIAETLQEAVLGEARAIDGVELSHVYRPASAQANVGGDFYDVFDLGDDRISILVGDVSGKGLAAAKITSLVRDGVRAYMLIDPDPASVMMKLNRLMYHSTDPESFATVFLGVLDLRTGRLLHANAGHTPMIISSDGQEPRLQYPTDPMCGAFVEARYKTHEDRLTPGDLLVLFTDGLTEARRGRVQFGSVRLAAVVEANRHLGATGLPEELLAQVETFSGGDIRDDIVVMCLALMEMRQAPAALRA